MNAKIDTLKTSDYLKKMKRTKITSISLLAVLFIFITINTQAQNERKYIRSGNRLYEKALADTTKLDTINFSNAEVEYRKALAKRPDDLKWKTNLGSALYKQMNFAEAQETFSKIAEESTDKQVKATAYHNLGNSYLFDNKLDESIEAYKNALRNNPADLDTKYNLLYAMQKKHEQEQQQNQDQNKDQNKDNQDQQNKDQQNKDKQNQDKNNQDKQNQDQNKQNQDKQNPDQNKQNQDKQNQNNQGENQPEQQKISQDNAERMLQALENDEKKTQEKVKKAQAAQARQRSTDKDW